MKAILFLVGIGLAGYAGYRCEPALRPSILGKSRAALSPTTDNQPSSTPEIDYSAITPDQLPPEVTLLSDVRFSDDATGLSMTLKSGAKAKVVRLVGTTLIIRFGNTEYITSLPVTETDLAKRLTSPPLVDGTAPTTPTPTPTPASTPDPTPAPEPTPSPSPTPTPTPEPTPTPAPEPAPAPDPFTSPAPEPTPAPAPEPPPAADPAPTNKPASQATILAIMRQSLTAKQIKEFSLNEVKTWAADSPELFEGVTYDIGTVTYEQETVFGRKSIVAKAFIRNGKVERWVWPKSGLTIQ